MKEKLEEKKRKLEGRIQYYERRGEQKYYCVKLKVAGGEGIMEVRKKIPASVLANSIYLEICRESPEAESLCLPSPLWDFWIRMEGLPAGRLCTMGLMTGSLWS